MVLNKKAIYLIAGGWNTIFGYFASLLIYQYYYNSLGIIFVGIVSNVIAISMSFTTYKIFVFKTKGNWWVEYIRCYLVYGFTAILGIIGLWVLVDIFQMQFWLAQLFLLIIAVIISYMGHSRFTFKK